MRSHAWTKAWVMCSLAGAFLLAVMTAPLRAQDDGEGTMVTDSEMAHALCELLDLARPELAAVKRCIEAKDYLKALATYRDRFV